MRLDWLARALVPLQASETLVDVPIGQTKTLPRGRADIRSQVRLDKRVGRPSDLKMFALVGVVAAALDPRQQHAQRPALKGAVDGIRILFTSAVQTT